jgi:hypothetical protein
MLYKSVPVLQYCSFISCKHLKGINFCAQYSFKQVEVVDLFNTPLCTTKPTQPPSHVAAIQRDIVNNRLRTA